MREIKTILLIIMIVLMVYILTLKTTSIHKTNNCKGTFYMNQFGGVCSNINIKSLSK